MLHRSFKPAKCKTSLKLASSRLKLMKNKKEVLLKQMKKELAQLLESGQDQTARIRVEHVVREEKTIAAYELLELYSELVVARLSIIESQKNCPIDLKEAVTSLIFASPRCADIPELMDIRKHFAGKYGKEFVSAAVELRPECGVSRMLVEKLSAKAPDGQTKLKILTAIAEEHDVKWDPTTFGEKELKPPNDLLNGPNTFQSASNTQPEHPIVQVPPSNVQVHPSRDQKNNAPVHFEHNVSSSASPQNFTSTDIGGGQATMPATSHPGVRPSGTGSERMEVRHSYSKDGNAFPVDRQNWNMEFKDATAAAQAAAESAERASMAARAAAELSSRGKITRQYSSESQKSNTHSLRNEGPRNEAASELPTERFAKDSGYQYRKQTEERPRKDAASKLPNKRFAKDSGYQDRKQTEEGPRKDAASNLPTERFAKVSGYQDRKQTKEGPRKDAASKFPTEQVAKDSGYQYRKQTEEVDRNKHDDPDEAVEGLYRDGYGDIKRSSRSASLRSSVASIDKDKLMNDLQKADRYSRKSSFEEEFIETENSAYLSGMNMKKHSIGSEVEFESNWQGGRQSDNLDYFGEERIKRQPSSVTPISHSSNHGNDYDVSPSSHQNFGIDLGEDPSVGIDQGNIHGDTMQTSFYNNDAVFFDQYGSDDDDLRFDTLPKYDGREPKLFAMSPGRESPVHLSANADTWSPRQNLSGSFEKSSSELHVSAEWHSPPEFDESLTKSAQPSQPDDSLSVAFDESDVPSSESEDELDKSRIGGKTDPGFLAHEENIFFRNPDDIHDDSHGLTGSFRVKKGDSASNRRQDLHYSSDDKELVEESAENNYGTESSAQSRRKFSFDEVPTHQSSSSYTKSQMASNDSASNRKQDLHYSSHDEELVDNSAERNQGTKFSAQSWRKFGFDEEPTPQSSSRFTKSQMASHDSASNREQDLDYSSHDEELVEVSAESNQGVEFIAPSQRKFGFDEVPNRQISSRRTKSQIASNDSPSNRKQYPRYSSDDEELVEERAGKNKGTESSDVSWRKSNFDEFPNHQSSSRSSKSQITSNDTSSGTFYNPVEGGKWEQSRQSSRLSSFNEAKATNNTLTPESPDTVKDDELFDQSSLESWKELKFGTLTGGFRNKGYRHPPYTRSPPGDLSSSTTAAEESVTATKRSHSLGSPAIDSSLNSEVSTKVENKSSSRTSITHSDLDTTDSEEELPQQNSRSKREPYSSKAAKEEVNTKSRFGAPVTYFDFDEDESVDLPKNNSTSTGRGGSAISRRTKRTPSSRTSSYSKATVGSEASINSDAYAKQRSSRNSVDSETPHEPRSEAANSGRGRNSPEPGAATQATYNPIPESKISLRGETLKSSAFERPSSLTSSASTESRESKFSLRGDSSVIEKPSSSLKTATSAGTEKRESKFSLPGESLKSSAFEKPSSALKTAASSASTESRESKFSLRGDSSVVEKPSSSLKTAKSASTEKRESKFSIRGEGLKSSTIEKPSSSLKTATSASTESPKTSASRAEPPSRESSLNKPSHVHPKLPDFDTIAALLQSHRTNIK